MHFGELLQNGGSYRLMEQCRSSPENIKENVYTRYCNVVHWTRFTWSFRGEVITASRSQILRSQKGIKLYVSLLTNTPEPHLRSQNYALSHTRQYHHQAWRLAEFFLYVSVGRYNCRRQIICFIAKRVWRVPVRAFVCVCLCMCMCVCVRMCVCARVCACVCGFSCGWLAVGVDCQKKSHSRLCSKPPGLRSVGDVVFNMSLRKTKRE